jgi:hypothetical protein
LSQPSRHVHGGGDDQATFPSYGHSLAGVLIQSLLSKVLNLL